MAEAANVIMRNPANPVSAGLAAAVMEAEWKRAQRWNNAGNVE